MNERPSLRIPLVPDVTDDPRDPRNTREAPGTHRTASAPSPGYVDVNQEITVNYDINIGTVIYSLSPTGEKLN